MPGAVFISHSSQDRDVASAACRALEDAGVRCWIAPRDILAGTEWDEAITGAIEEAVAVVLVLSAAANESREVAREVRAAVIRKLPIVPVFIEDLVPSKALSYALSTAHRLDAWEPPLADHLDRLVEVVRSHVAAAGATAPNAPRARLAQSLVGSMAAGMALFAVAGFILLSLDILGLTGITKRYSEDLVNQVFSSYYPRAAQKELTVVLITDGALDALEESWPASYGFHAQVLTALLVHKPKAVMIDLLFKDRRRDDTLPELERALGRLRQKGVPVYIAAAGSNGNAVLPQLAPLVTTVPVPKLTDQYDRATREYPLLLRGYDSAGAPTAALRLYRDFAMDGASGEPDLERDFADPMLIFWGTRPPERQESRIACRPPPPSAATAAWRRLFGGQDSVQTNCYYAQTLPVDYLFTHPSDPQIASLLEGRVVLYGASLVGVEDYVYPATHTRLPGVFMHAMALDNLMTFGTGYPRRAGADGAVGRWFGVLEVLVLAVYGAMLGLSEHARRTMRTFQAHRRGFGQVVVLTVIGVLVAFAFSIAVTLWAFRVQHMASINWLGCLGIALAIMMAREWAVRFGNRSRLLNRY